MSTSTPSSVEYLAPDFDSSTLRVPQLRSILLEHSITHSPTAKKPDLLALFESQVRPKAANLLSARSRVKPSAKGITVVSENGSETASVVSVPVKRRGRPRKTITEEPQHLDPEPEPPIKKARGSRGRSAIKDVEAEAEPEIEIVIASPKKRGKRAVKAEEVDEGAEAGVEDEPQPVPSRGRVPRSRSKASTPPASIPSVPSSSRRRTLAAPNAEPEQPVPEVPSQKASKRKSSASLGKVKEEEIIVQLGDSEKEDEPAAKIRKTPKRSREDISAFSDFNPFQSGSEEAADRERRRRKSSIGPIKKPAQPRFSAPAPSTSTPTGILRKVGPSRENLRTPPPATRELMREERDLSSAEKYNRIVSAKMNEITSADIAQEPTVVVHSEAAAPQESLLQRVQDHLPLTATSTKSAIPSLALLLLLLPLLLNFKTQSASLGFCDVGSNTNDIIIDRQSALADATTCVARRAQVGLDNPDAAKHIECDVSALPLIPFVPRPQSCTTCPPHAICEDGDLIACEPEFLPSSHPLAFLSPAVDGLPGLSPRVFPPRCRPDTVKKRLIGGLATEMEKDLARGRGYVVCAGLGKEDGKKGEGEIYGMDETTLRERYASRRDPIFSREQFDEVFEAALNDLVQHDDVVETIDVNGISWYAARKTELTLACRAKLEAVSLLTKWKSQLGSTLAVLATIAWIRSTFLRRKEEVHRAEDLVKVVLKRLQDQEYLHYSDPVTTPSSFIPPDQLRDLVMPPSGSSAYRNRLWRKVNDLIEANANVAVREQEVKGELWKTWEWQGVPERRVTWVEAGEGAR